MPIRFNQLSSAPARATQIYLVLIGCAANQQVIPYGRLAQRVGLLTPTWLFASLDRLAEWCLQEGLPPITSLAVAEATGTPDRGYRLPLEDLAAQQNRARKFDWYAIVPPTLAELERTICRLLSRPFVRTSAEFPLIQPKPLDLGRACK